jgi:hypothetical protein
MPAWPGWLPEPDPISGTGASGGGVAPRGSSVTGEEGGTSVAGGSALGGDSPPPPGAFTAGRALCDSTDAGGAPSPWHPIHPGRLADSSSHRGHRRRGVEVAGRVGRAAWLACMVNSKSRCGKGAGAGRWPATEIRDATSHPAANARGLGRVGWPRVTISRSRTSCWGCRAEPQTATRRVIIGASVPCVQSTRDQVSRAPRLKCAHMRDAIRCRHRVAQRRSFWFCANVEMRRTRCAASEQTVTSPPRQSLAPSALLLGPWKG